MDLLAVYVCRAALAAMLLTAAGAKALQWTGFRAYLSNAAVVSVLPSLLQTLLGAATILVEGFLAVAILTGVGGRWAPIAVVCFLYSASCFLAVQFVASGVDSDCPCWGATRTASETVHDLADATPARVGRDLLRPAGNGLRNALLCAVAMYLAAAEGVGITYWWAWSGVPLVLIAAGLAASIVSEHHRLRLERHPRYDALAPLLAPLVVLDFYEDRPRAAARRTRDRNA